MSKISSILCSSSPASTHGGWHRYRQHLTQVLSQLAVTDRSGAALDLQAGLDRWSDWTRGMRGGGGCVYLVGNGASASMAAHFAADLAKNGALLTRTLTEPAMLTALANDACYEVVYAEPLRWWMNPADMLVCISSSGNSPNIVAAAAAAREKGGRVVTLSAMGTDNRIRARGDLNFYFPAETYGLAESAHAVLLHYWMDAVEASC